MRRLFSQSVSNLPCTTHKKPALTAVLLAISFTCFAQNQPPALDQANSPPSQPPVSPAGATVTIPAGTHLALVLTQPIQSRYVRRGDDIYAQTTSPVSSGNQVVIPPGTFVQAKVDKLERHGGIGEVRLESMAITFPDGYVTPIEGPMMLQTSQGYAWQDPGSRRTIAAFALPLGGAGLGALIGHSIGKADSSTTSTMPPGCTGGPPFCTTVTTPVFGSKGKDAIIGAGVGGIIGGITAMTLLFSSHHFFLEAGAPVEMTLQQSVTLSQDEVAKAVRDSLQHPAYQQPILPPPIYPYPPVDSGPEMPPPPTTPGTPPTVIPGPPGPNGTPGPPIVIPGTPPTT